MIISHEHRFIFLKTRKTAGTSVEIALSRFCGPDDVITPINAEDEQIRASSGGRGPQNYRFPVRRYQAGDWRLLMTQRRLPAAYHHIQLDHVRAHVPPKVWNSYYKFSIARNPWDAQVSGYFWAHAQREMAFTDFIGTTRSRRIAHNYKLYSGTGDTVEVDMVCRYENLAADLAAVARDVGLPRALELPHAKSSTRVDRRPIVELYTAEDVDAVRTMARPEIEMMGYSFPT